MTCSKSNDVVGSRPVSIKEALVIMFNSSVNREARVIRGSGNREWRGYGCRPAVLLPVPACSRWHGHHYHFVRGPGGLLEGGIAVLVMGIACAIFSALAFVFREPIQFITFASVAVLGVITGSACIITHYTI